MKAIETVYNGYRFRSRLEARWAVFFDALGIEWQYEVEGFDLGEGIYYLPDFWLPTHKLWIEIKGTNLTFEENKKAEMFIKNLPVYDTSETMYILVGPPGLDIDGLFSYKVFGNGYPKGIEEKDRTGWCHCPLCGFIDISWYSYMFSMDENRVLEGGLGCENCDFGLHNPSLGRIQKEANFHKGTVLYRKPSFFTNSPELKNAYNMSRSARFEHGENGIPKPLEKW